MKFSYQLRDKNGKRIKGQLEGDSKSSVLKHLLQENCCLIELREVKPETRWEFNLNFKLQNVDIRDLALMSRQLSTMVAAGLPLVRSFEILGEQSSQTKLKKLIREIAKEIEEGQPLWHAMSKHPAIFSQVYISMIRAGETGGIMDEVLDHLASHLEREQEMRSRINSALIYPIIIIVMSVLLVFFLISFFMPQFRVFFQATGVELPVLTRLLLRLGQFIRETWILLLLSLFILVLLIKMGNKTDWGKYRRDYLYLHLPWVGKVVSRMAVARFARTMAILLRSGVPVLSALEVVEGIVGNVVIARAIKQALSSISEGNSIAAPLKASGVFEPMVVHMIAVGEETGALGAMLIALSDYFEREIAYIIEAMMAIFEPLMILLVGILVGAVVLATLLPIFEMLRLMG